MGAQALPLATTTAPSAQTHQMPQVAHDDTPERRAARAKMLADAISLTGMSAQTFASHVLVRDPRTVRHWLAATKPMPDVVANRLTTIAHNALQGRAWWVLAGAIGTLSSL